MIINIVGCRRIGFGCWNLREECRYWWNLPLFLVRGCVFGKGCEIWRRGSILLVPLCLGSGESCLGLFLWSIFGWIIFVVGFFLDWRLGKRCRIIIIKMINIIVGGVGGWRLVFFLLGFIVWVIIVVGYYLWGRSFGWWIFFGCYFNYTIIREILFYYYCCFLLVVCRAIINFFIIFCINVRILGFVAGIDRFGRRKNCLC